MNIQFYLNDSLEKGSSTHIYTLYKMTGNPFKVDDVIHLSVSTMSPRKYSDYKQEFQDKMIKMNDEQKELFHLKNVKLVTESKFIDLESDEFIIEYHCEFVEPFKN